MKKIQLIIFLPLFSLIYFSSCEKSDPEPEVQLSFSAEARNYLGEVLDIMQNNSINKERIDWSNFRSTVLLAANGAETIEDTYAGIMKALELLEDNHSFYVQANGGGFSGAVFNCSLENVTETSWPQHIGYVKVNSFSGAANDSEAINYAKAIQQQIRDQDSDQLAGWIVDLRGNLGGNMWPMIAGIGPVLGEGTAGYFVDSDNNRSSWGFINGSSMSNGVTAITTVFDSYELLKSNPKVAVLLDNGVASSGEAVAVSFMGRDNTKSFGASTCGLSTSNQNFPLSDGATLFLTTAYFADRDLKVYGGMIEPDTQIDNSTIIQLATDWIME